MSRHPEIKWAQRSDKVFLTVELPDAKNPQVKIEPEGRFIFSASVGPENVPYELDLPLFGKVNVEESKISVGLRNVFCVIQKAEKGWWKRLLKTEGKQPPYLKVDWDKWVDEDEEDELSSKKFDNFDLGSMNDFSGFNMGGSGMEGLGGDETDSDDEDTEMNAKADVGKQGADEDAEMSAKTEVEKEGASQGEEKLEP